MKNTRLLALSHREFFTTVSGAQREEMRLLRKVNTIKIFPSLRVEHTNYYSGTLVIGTIKYKLPSRMGSISWNHVYRLLAEVFIAFNAAASKTILGDTNQRLFLSKKSVRLKLLFTSNDRVANQSRTDPVPSAGSREPH